MGKRVESLLDNHRTFIMNSLNFSPVSISIHNIYHKGIKKHDFDSQITHSVEAQVVHNSIPEPVKTSASDPMNVPHDDSFDISTLGTVLTSSITNSLLAIQPVPTLKPLLDIHLINTYGLIQCYMPFQQQNIINVSYLQIINPSC